MQTSGSKPRISAIRPPTDKIAQQQNVPRAVEQRKLPGDAVVTIQLQLDGVAHHRHHHGQMAVHRTLRARGGAAGVDDHRQIAVVEVDVGLDLGLAFEQVVEVSQTGGCGLAGQVDGNQVDAALLERGAAIRLGMQIVVDQREAHLGVIEDVIHVIGSAAWY